MPKDQDSHARNFSVGSVCCQQTVFVCVHVITALMYRTLSVYVCVRYYVWMPNVVHGFLVDSQVDNINGSITLYGA